MGSHSLAHLEQANSPYETKIKISQNGGLFKTYLPKATFLFRGRGGQVLALISGFKFQCKINSTFAMGS